MDHRIMKERSPSSTYATRRHPPTQFRLILEEILLNYFSGKFSAKQSNTKSVRVDQSITCPKPSLLLHRILPGFGEVAVNSTKPSVQQERSSIGLVSSDLSFRQ